MRLSVPSMTELKIFAKNFAKNLHGGEIIALTGELGAGKTAFTKLLLKEFGINKNITSPTFVLMLPYRAKNYTFYHMDLYRLKSYKDVEALGVAELWGKPENIFLIEWADKIQKYLPKEAIFVDLSVGKDANQRIINITNVPKNFKI